ncbi:hypothetical protein JB92DRAFT_2835157 [Gautieria morchelliformis]|nr:hypothetical protein JB92DRAFT_2835157 [Gautieria morchelliformis]
MAQSIAATDNNARLQGFGKVLVLDGVGALNAGNPGNSRRGIWVAAPSLESKGTTGVFVLSPRTSPPAPRIISHRASMPVAPCTPNVLNNWDPSYICGPKVLDERVVGRRTGSVVGPLPVQSRDA